MRDRQLLISEFICRKVFLVQGSLAFIYKMDAIVSYSLVTVKVDRDLPDTYTIVVDHNADHFPRFYEFASLPEIFKNKTFARDADSQPPEAGLPLFDEYDDLFYGGPDDLYTGPRFVENTEEFVLVFFDGFSKDRFLNRHSADWKQFGKYLGPTNSQLCVKPEFDSWHLRRIVVPASGFSADPQRVRQQALVQFRVETAIFQAQAGFYTVQGVPLIKTSFFAPNLLEQALVDSQRSGSILSRYAYFLIDVFKLAYDSDAHLDYWVIVKGYWKTSDLPDGVSWRSCRSSVNTMFLSERDIKSYMPKSASTPHKAILPWHWVSALASARMCGVPDTLMSEKLRSLRKTVFWHQGHTFVNYFRSCSRVYNHLGN